MVERCTWISNGFIDRNFYAPFVIEKDINYYPDLKKRYRLFLEKARKCNADEESLSIIIDFKHKILESIREYYKGDLIKAHIIIRNLIKKCISNPFAVNGLSEINSYDIMNNNELNKMLLFRARVSNRFTDFSPKEMLNLPKPLRSKTGNYRFSIPGTSCLYMCNSSYGSWLEMGRPVENEFNVSPVLIDKNFKMFNLAVMIRDFSRLNNFNKQRVHCWLKLIMLMIATSYVIEESDRNFKSEYIVSQMIMLSCKKLGLDGIVYYSKRVEDEIFSKFAINVALYTPYETKDYSMICNNIQLNTSYNYSKFKILLPSIIDRFENSDITFNTRGANVKVGDYSSQYSFQDTYFYRFDKFLFSRWKVKKTASFCLKES